MGWKWGVTRGRGTGGDTWREHGFRSQPQRAAPLTPSPATAPPGPTLSPPPSPSSQQHDFGSDIIPGAKDLGCKVQAHLFKGYWEDIGTVRAFYESNLALTDSPNPNFRCGALRVWRGRAADAGSRLRLFLVGGGEVAWRWRGSNVEGAAAIGLQSSSYAELVYDLFCLACSVVQLL